MIEIEVEADDWTAAMPDVEAVVEQAATAALGRIEGDVVVLLTDNAAVRDLNARFRDKDKPTNVLSFPMVQPDLIDTVSQNSDDGEVLLGDIVLAHGVCVAEAAERGISTADHASHLIVHGTLHLLGYDHITDDEGDAMEAIERDALALLGIADPYAIRED